MGKLEKVTIRVDENLKERYRSALESEGSTMSQHLRKQIESFVEGVSPDTAHLPDDADLAEAYQLLVRYADENGEITVEAAKSTISQRLGIPKSVVRRNILDPLEKEGYIEPSWGVLKVDESP